MEIGFRLLLATLCALGLVQCRPGPSGSNLLLIVTDTLRADALACYGGSARTPHICGLAERGVLFEVAYANAPWTPPSAVSIFTGNYPTAYANLSSGKTYVPSFWVSDEEFLLGEALRERGYDVGFGSISPLVTNANVLQGFEVLSQPPDPVDPALSGVAKTGEYLRNHDGTPFFLLEWFMDPHAPYEAEGVLEALDVDPGQLSQPLRFYSTLGHQVEPRMREHAPEMSEYEIDVLRRLYFAEVERIDEKVGNLLRALDDAGLRKSTYVVFTADHGEGFGEHGTFLHGVSFHDELTRVPWIMAGPEIAPGTRVSRPVSLVDLMPTLSDLLAADCLNEPQGRSLRPLLGGEAGAATGESDHVHYLASADKLIRGIDAVVDENYKLIAMLNGRVALFDRSDDPGELRDVADQRTEVVSRMRAELGRIRGEKDERRRRNFAHRTEEDKLEVHERTLQGLRALGYVE